ncbi:MAG: PepSY domain-containing protein [Neisseria sp.]|uniref:PepSY domain-containing protein n=1 Tax=Neisseria sp. TaxID=192066 RepID=UPI0026DC6DA2|nr:PepSY domain-containing protein [Neisseria sp.]MDO4641644.1 PepSY domain-containing protein [Neisseria sp.]
MKKWLLTSTLIALSTSAFAGDDRIEQKIYQDPAFEQNRAKAVKLLESRGYRITDIEADDYMGKPAFDVEAYKGRDEYDIKLSYPDLRILKEKLDR